MSETELWVSAPLKHKVMEHVLLERVGRSAHSEQGQTPVALFWIK